MQQAESKKFNMSAEIRTILDRNPKATGRETLEALQLMFPGETINEASCGVAFSIMRKKLGLRTGKSKPVKDRVRSNAQHAPSIVGALEAAKVFVTAAGGLKNAMAVLTHINELPTA